MEENNHQVLIDEILYSVTLLITRVSVRTSRQCEVGNATGFFFQCQNRKFLVTNKHVVINEQENYFPDNLLVRIHMSRTSNIINQYVEIPLYDNDSRQMWIEHSNREIDVVVIPIERYLPEGAAIRFFEPSDIPPQNTVLGIQDTCMVIGYPKRFHDDIHNLPIVRVGSIASPYGAFFQGHRHFLLDATLHRGTSGSPVVLPSARTTRTISESGEIGFIPGTPTFLLGINSGEYYGLGLNAVWYSDVIQEIVSAPSQT